MLHGVKLRGSMGINKSGHLTIGNCDTVELAKRYGTPLYVLDEYDIRTRCREYRNGLAQNAPDSRVVYAGKAFLCLAMCRLVAEEGLGLDVVSGGELYTARAAGFPMDKVLFHGNNKSPSELIQALDAGVGRIVVDSIYELQLLNDICRQRDQRARILIRVTPGVEAHTHSYIQTGQQDSNFGVGIQNGQAYKAVELACAMDGISLVGLHCHIGSQIFELQSFRAAVDIVLDFCVQLKKELGFVPEELDFGGGLGIVYTEEDSPAGIGEFCEFLGRAFVDGCRKRGLEVPRLMVEPGRSIVGEAGTTLYTVGTIKEIPGMRKYVAIDGGMGDNPRVALYGARYQAIVANKADRDLDDLVTIAGKCCESGDILIRDIMLPSVEPGDILAVLSTGAYNYSMSSNYNRLPRPAVVLVMDGKADLIVRRETYADLVEKDVIPERFMNYGESEAACSKDCPA